MTHYVASKAAVIGLTRALARELGPASAFVTGQVVLVDGGRVMA